MKGQTKLLHPQQCEWLDPLVPHKWIHIYIDIVVDKYLQSILRGLDDTEPWVLSQTFEFILLFVVLTQTKY